MNEDYKAGQGSIIPTLLIGAGGTGSRIVDRIAARAEHLPNWDNQLRPLTSFVSIDTNELDQHELKHIPHGNRINIAAFDKARAVENFRRSKDKHISQWLDEAYRPRPGFKPGAGQIRIESRLGFFYHSPHIRQRFKEIISECLRPGITWRQSTPPKYNVYLFTTLAGGTGSGSFLSIAYLIDNVIREQHWQPRVIGNLLLSTLVQNKVGPELHNDIHANTYAALKELEYLTKLDYPQVNIQEGRNEDEFPYYWNKHGQEKLTVKNRPFFLSFIFDTPPHLSLINTEAVVADAAYLQIFTPVINELAGELDNYEKNLEGLTEYPGDFKDVGQGYSKNFSAFGAAALVLPGLDLLEYCALRFAAEAIRTQITFGTNTSEQSDDRTQAIAKLAIDYSDPKFLRMDDHGKERMINDAFIQSVQEMARQDSKEGFEDGYWLKLVTEIDEGLITGKDEKEESIRAISTINRILQDLDNDREDLINKVSITERAFVFHKEGISQYLEHISKLREQVRSARQIVLDGIRSLESAAREGDAIQQLKLNPMEERYLVIRLLEKCQSQWLPQAQAELEQASKKDISLADNYARLEEEYEQLKHAAESGGWFKRGDDEFYAARDQAHQSYRRAAKDARQSMVAEARVRQFTELMYYLEERSRQYSRLATQMDGLVNQLEGKAERLRRGEISINPSYALRVEVFETLDEPRQRLWEQVYQYLFISDGKYISTFDRKIMGETIASQLKPVISRDGRVRTKTSDEIVTDLRNAMTDQGKERMRKHFFGGDGQAGLDLVQGLEIEAKLVLGENKELEEGVISQDAIHAYQQKKFRALLQLSNVLARVSTISTAALDDGVIVNRTRLMVGNMDDTSQGAGQFFDRLKSELELGGRQVKTKAWHDPHLLIVHDVEMPIPLYYFDPVITEIQEAYIQVASNEQRGYDLHTAKDWEKSLPNLDPRNTELAMDWTLKTFIDAYVAKIIIYNEAAGWVWRIEDGKALPDNYHLGETLTHVLYELEKVHQNEKLRADLEQQITMSQSDVTHYHAGREAMLKSFDRLYSDIERKGLRGDLTSEEQLDRPILRTLIHYLQAGEGMQPKVSAHNELYQSLAPAAKQD